MKKLQLTLHLALLAIVAAGLLAVPPETQAQALPEERENYAWITNTDGSAWKKEINPDGELHFADSEKQEIAQIVVPKHAIINRIYAGGCVNLTNIVFQPGQARKYGLGDYSGVLYDVTLNISAKHQRATHKPPQHNLLEGNDKPYQCRTWKPCRRMVGNSMDGAVSMG